MADYKSKFTGEEIDKKLEDVDKKLDKVTNTTTYNQVYIKKADGTQTMYNVGHYNNPSSIPQYSYASASVGVADNGGTFAVAMPQQPYQPAPKKYVDERLHRYGIELIDELGGTIYFSIITHKKSEEITLDIEPALIYMTPAIYTDFEGTSRLILIESTYSEDNGFSIGTITCWGDFGNGYADQTDILITSLNVADEAFL